MTPKEAEAIAKIMRRNHGDGAIAFAKSKLRYFRSRPSADDAVMAWTMVSRALVGLTDDRREPARVEHAVG